jgi:hypothetical protein
MGRQLRTLREGESRLRVPVTRASSTRASIPNYGVTLITTATGTDYVLDPPTEGVTKVLYNNEATTGVLVRANPKGQTGVTFTTTATDIAIEFDGTGDKVVTLLGLSTSRWLITAIRPVSTAIVIAGT